MIYKIIKETDDITIFARIDDDGLCRVTCIAENPEFQAHIKDGAELQSAEGQAMSQEEANQFISTLP